MVQNLIKVQIYSYYDKKKTEAPKESEPVKDNKEEYEKMITDIIALVNQSLDQLLSVTFITQWLIIICISLLFYNIKTSRIRQISTYQILITQKKNVKSSLQYIFHKKIPIRYEAVSRDLCSLRE